MIIHNVQAFDYGLQEIPSFLDNETNQLKEINNTILQHSFHP